jgi:cyclopropane-fatty-acyl-phospholipid synthase
MVSFQAHNRNMLYKFKSKATADLILLEPQGKQFLQLIGKTVQAKGIIEPQHMPAAIAALKDAIAQQETEQQMAREQAKSQGAPAPVFDNISLRQRCKPIIDMLERSHRENHPIVWGV